MRAEERIDELVREHERLVHFQVNRYLRRCFVRGMEREDLVAWGMMALVQAARAWDPERGAFSTLACRAIEWTLQRHVGREWSFQRAVPQVSLDEVLRVGEGSEARERCAEFLADPRGVERAALEGETHAEVRAAVAALSPKDRMIIERHYYQEVPIARVAGELGMSRQAAADRRRKALRRLRHVLSPGPACAAGE